MMNNKYISKILAALIIAINTLSCSLEKYPIDKLDPNIFFSTENDLILYSNSFYNILPTGDDIMTKDSKISDYMATASGVNNFIYGNYTTQESELENWWKWDELRNINYFIENNINENISVNIRNKYNGLARFFRAFFYFEKVKTFGNVPWYDKVLSSSDPDLYKPQDDRKLVMEKIIEDLNFAIINLPDNISKDASTITKWSALALKSRICLFEGTYRKYHPNAAIQEGALDYLQMSSDASQELINSNKYSLNKNGKTPYRDLFTSTNALISEIILIDTYSAQLERFNRANWLYTSSSYGDRPGLTKKFINTFLNKDGSRFTDNINYDKTPFLDEIKERDARLSQIIRTPDYKLLGNLIAPDFGHTKTGYHFIKYTQDDNANLAMQKNTNSIPLIRYAEILLNYAEASAELGKLTNEIWDITIGELRKRAGISNTSRTTVTCKYMQGLFPNISSSDILEVRRERAIELCGEGFRFDDIRRWRSGHLLEADWDGIYIDILNTPIDMNNDGKPDVCFTSKAIGNAVEGVYYFIFSDAFDIDNRNIGGKLKIYNNINKKFEDKNYLYPIPQSAILKNTNLIQDPLW